MEMPLQTKKCMGTSEATPSPPPAKPIRYTSIPKSNGLGGLLPPILILHHAALDGFKAGQTTVFALTTARHLLQIFF